MCDIESTFYIVTTHLSHCQIQDGKTRSLNLNVHCNVGCSLFSTFVSRKLCLINLMQGKCKTQWLNGKESFSKISSLLTF